MQNPYTKLNIYRYHDAYTGSDPLCIYLCSLESSTRALIIPLIPSPINNSCFKISTTRQFAHIEGCTEIHLNDLILPCLFIDGKPAKINSDDLSAIATYLIDTHIQDFKKIIHNKIKPDSFKSALLEATIHFLLWTKIKYQMSMLDYTHKTTVYENGVYWANLGHNVGAELNKSRPVLIWKKRINQNNESYNSYIVIPITSKHKNATYKMNVPLLLNGRDSFLRIEDIQRISIRRISRPLVDDDKNIIFIDDDKRNEIKEGIKNFLIFDNCYSK